MQIAYTEAQRELQRELREYFAALMTPERRDALAGGIEAGGQQAYRDVVRQMGADGWLGISWPEQYGGQNRSMMEQLIFGDEASIAGVPVPFLTLNTVGPTIMEYGTDEQKEALLPKILRGELHFAIGYSEPDAGTDLASLSTRAERDGDEWVINGSKMWTSLIESADYVWLAARTDPTVAKHKGISVFLVPTTSPGFSYTPVRTLSGTTTSQTFYDDVRVPAGALVGEVNGGWRLVTGQLNRERVALCSPAGIQTALAETVEWASATHLADGARVIDQQWVQSNLGRVHAKVEFLKLINWKIAWGVRNGVSPANASATKVFGTEFATEAYRLLMECFGDDAYVRSGSPGAIVKGRVERAYRSALILTFGGGTNEVQRDIIAMVGLGMPRAPR
ncbi:MAG TPA: acyl-CoA dehydrogenase family protein [Ilumatobacter sp.]|nr:acyl-CoA dehydrogenase family protein [Ilumatobacter sp.]